jgi:Uma2 family endonuclease
VPLARYPSDVLTCEDLWAIPDDGRRRELIDGMLVVHPSPAHRHQRALGRLHLLLANACPNDLEVLLAPFDYKISDTTLVIPDILVARKAEIGTWRLDVAPLLVIEIRSPSTARFDAGTKRLVYEAAGVQWYWLVDPDEPRLTVLELVNGKYVERASVAGDTPFDAAAPVSARVVPADLVCD